MKKEEAMSLKNDVLRRIDAVAEHLQAARRVIEDGGTVEMFTYAINNLRDELDTLMAEDEDIELVLEWMQEDAAK
jgi:hypothetical protein